MPMASQSAEVRIAWDATVVRPPLSGVHLSVQAELLAMLGMPAAAGGVLLSLCPQLRQRAVETGMVVPALPKRIQGVAARILWQQLQLPKLLRAQQAVVLHATAYTAPLRSPVPVVLNVHDIIALEHPELCSRLNVWHMRLLLARSIRRAALNVTTTQHVADRVQAVLDIPADRIEVVPLGVDAARFAGERADSTDTRPYLLFVGNLEPKKGLPVLLDAYARVAGALGIDLVLAGRPGWRCDDLMDRLRGWCGAGRVVLAGRVSDDKLCCLYQNAWAFAFPSVCEGFGMPVLEAMAAGTPVLHSDHAAVLEVAGGAGMAVPVGDAEALAQALRRLHASPDLRRELVAAGRERAGELSWERRAAGVLELLHATARAHGQNGASPAPRRGDSSPRTPQ
jgi:glycosyltransferase involved in cell wall biosynthesis